MPRILATPKGLRAWASPISRFSSALILAALFAISGEARAITLSAAQTSLWDLSLVDSDKKCRFTLRAGPVRGESRPVAVSGVCIQDFPILSKVQGWSLPSSDRFLLLDASGNTVLDFALTTDTKFIAAGPKGEAYDLVATTRPLMNPAALGASEQQAAAAAKSQPPQAGETKAGEAKTGEATTAAESPKTARSAAPTANEVAGRYSILRAGGKDTGCMLTLDEKAAGKGGKKASLAPACRDQGIVIFDPVGWRLVKGRLVLTARKGHTTQLDLQPDGEWVKDPKVGGASLALKKQ